MCCRANKIPVTGRESNHGLTTASWSDRVIEESLVEERVREFVSCYVQTESEIPVTERSSRATKSLSHVRGPRAPRSGNCLDGSWSSRSHIVVGKGWIRKTGTGPDAKLLLRARWCDKSGGTAHSSEQRLPCRRYEPLDVPGDMQRCVLRHR